MKTRQLLSIGRLRVTRGPQIDRAIKAEADRVSSTCAPMACNIECEVTGGDTDCTCVSVEQFNARLEHRLADTPMVPAPFTGTPYDANSEED